MIVKCEQCQTRFKIPDEKVTEKGVKVRCTKCQHTFRVKRDGTSSATGLSPAIAPTQLVPAIARPAEDPFARFGATVDDGMGEATRPGMYALGVEASRNPQPLQPSFAAQMDLPSQVFEQPTRVGRIPSVPSGRTQLVDEATQAASPFDFAAALGPTEPAPPAPFDFHGGPPPREEAVYAPPARHAPSVQTYQPPAQAYQPPPDPVRQPATLEAPAQDPFASMEFHTGDQSSPAAPMATQPEMPSVFGPDGGDFFTSQEEPPRPQSVQTDSLSSTESGEVAADTSQRAALFDMPPPEPSMVPEGFQTQTQTQSPEPVAAPVARPNPVANIVSAQTAAPIEKFEPIAPRRKLGGLIFNVVIASVLVGLLTVILTVYLSEGKVELASFSADRLKGTFSSPSEWATLDISNGLYETRSGRPVFFVRGDVKNGTAKATRVKVRAEILDGNSVIRHADVWIGESPTPEDLYAIAVAEDVTRLMAKLEKSAGEVMPGEKRAFLVPFYEYPPDLSGFRVKVRVIEAGQGETAAR